MQHQYLITTDKKDIPTDKLIVMLDGTVPGWKPLNTDLHFDHHREGGADIQLDEITFTSREEWKGVLSKDLCFVTTQLDADACAAAAYFQLWGNITKPSLRKLRAIAYECDHLGVPEELSHIAYLAFKAVAAMRIVSKAFDFTISEAFQYHTEWLIEACKGLRPFPGERGEADNYQEQLEADAKLLIEQGRAYSLHGVPVVSLCGMGNRYIDPRSCLKAWDYYFKRFSIEPRAQTITIKPHKSGNGLSYTLGCIPNHPEWVDLNYHKVFPKLTELEKARNPDAEGWGGGRTVGGSGWNTPTSLLPMDVVDVLLE